MRLSTIAAPLVTAAACCALLAACSEFSRDPAPQPRRHNAVRSAPAVKPEIASPASHKTCTETFKLEVTDTRYDRCIASLSELEAK